MSKLLFLLEALHFQTALHYFFKTKYVLNTPKLYYIIALDGNDLKTNWNYSSGYYDEDDEDDGNDDDDDILWKKTSLLFCHFLLWVK